MSSFDRGRPGAFLLRLLVVLLLVGGSAEVWFRTAMTPCQTPSYTQEGPGDMLRLDSRGPRDGLTTIGRLCRPVVKWHVNNAGWNCACDYLPASQRRTPMVALFGDSYVAATMIGTDEHIEAQLPQQLPGTTSYAFGLNGWYLEQYVAASRYARDQFQPDVLVVLIDPGDVRGSREFGASFWWQLARRGDSFQEVPPGARYTPSRMLALAKKSALVRFLRYNLSMNLPGLPYVAVDSPARHPPREGNPKNARMGTGWYLQAADYMVGRLCAENPGKPIIFMAHSDRYLPAQDATRASLFPDAEAVRIACQGRSQCHFVDLRPVFSRDWAAHHVRFEAADGTHWNGYANRLVARTIAEMIKSHGLLTGWNVADALER